MLPPIHDKYYLSELLHTLTGFTLALGGATVEILDTICEGKLGPENSMLPPKNK